MPMVELTTTKDALDDEAKQRLATRLSTIALELEAAPFADFGEVDYMQALSWCFVNEQDVFLGGRRHPKPIYRVTVTIPDGAPGVFGPLAAAGRKELVERITEAVLDADGAAHTSTEAHRVWVHLRSIDNGHWAGFGEILTLPELAAYGLKDEGADQRVDRLRRAALQSWPAADVS